MFPRTHLYFANRLLSRTSDAIALGSVILDMLTGGSLTWDDTHRQGAELYSYLGGQDEFRDFALAAVTHGAAPAGLDYYGDKSYPPYDCGFCFEKARPLVEKTIAACRIPKEIGWWKAHNIVEMGIELRVAENPRWGQDLQRGLANQDFVLRLAGRLAGFFPLTEDQLIQRMRDYPELVELNAATPESLAQKYAIQMSLKHGIEIDTAAVAGLIEQAGAQTAADLPGFFVIVERRVASVLRELTPI